MLSHISCDTLRNFSSVYEKSQKYFSLCLNDLHVELSLAVNVRFVASAACTCNLQQRPIDLVLVTHCA